MRALLIGFGVLLAVASLAQEASTGPKLDFAALIVGEMDASVDWYGEVLGFDLLDSRDFPSRGIRQANLRSGDVRLELIELESAIDPETAIEGFDTKTRLQGFFKIGFTVPDFDQIVERCTQLGVEFHGSVVSDASGQRMVILLDPDGNRIQLFDE